MSAWFLSNRFIKPQKSQKGREKRIFIWKYQNMNVETKCINDLYNIHNVLYDVFVKNRITNVNL